MKEATKRRTPRSNKERTAIWEERKKDKAGKNYVVRVNRGWIQANWPSCRPGGGCLEAVGPRIDAAQICLAPFTNQIPSLDAGFDLMREAKKSSVGGQRDSCIAGTHCPTSGGHRV